MKPRNIIFALIGLVVLVAGVFAAPLALRGPQVVAISPADGSQTVNPLAPFQIEFDQWVQADSLRSAVSLEPAAPFELAVERNVATLTPQGGLSYGANYRLTIGAGVRNLLGRSMEQPASTSFATVPYVAVANVGPANDAQDVALNAPLTVEFASPVVSPTLVQQAADDPRVGVPQPLLLNPAVPGTGRWLSPSRFSFSPDEGWSAATTYSATLNEQLIPDGSARMEQAVSWQFTTSATLLTGTRPFDGASDVAADGAIEVRLARDVDVASASQQFTLTKQGESQPVQGSVQADKGGFFFKPAAPLERGATYTASIGAGVKAASGAAINNQPLTWNFSVIGDLAVLESFPPASATDVLTLTQQIGVRFNHPVVAVTTPADGSTLPVPLTINPPVQGLGRWLDTSTFIISPTAPLNPSTQYQVAVAAGLTDQTGGALKEAFSFSFTTMSPLVNGSIPADREQYASPNEPLLLVFNQPMDMGSLQGAVRLLAPDGNTVPGTLARASRNATVFLPGDNNIPPSDFTGFTVAFTPNQPLARGGRYTLRVDTAARAEGSNAPLANVYESVFQVAPLPALVETVPAANATAADPSFPVRLNFGTPMDWASVEQNLTIVPKPTEIVTGSSTTEFYPYFMLEPETDYRISVGEAARDQWGVRLGREVSFSFRTAALSPALMPLGVNNQIAMYNANVAVRVPLQTTNIPSLSYRLWPLDVVQATELINSYERWQAFAPDGDPLKQGDVETNSQRNKPNITLLALERLEPGMYFLDVRGAGQFERQLLAVSSTALTVKRSADQLFIWAVDVGSGQPVANLPLSSLLRPYNPEQGATEPENLGNTDGEGILKAAFTGKDAYAPLYVWSAAEGTFAFSSSDWGSDISPWAFNLPGDTQPRVIAGNLSTDRPIYRPGQLVRIKGVLRMDNDGRYSMPPANQRVQVEVSGPDGTKIFSNALPLSEFGSFDTSLPMQEGAKLGFYSISARMENDPPERTINGQFTLAEYRKPVFEVEVAPTKPDLLAGDKIEATLTARYFAGGVLANAPVRWRLLAEPLYFSDENFGGYQFNDVDDAMLFYRWFDSSRPGGRELVSEGEGTTDANGKLALSLPAELAKNGGSRRFVVDVEVTDVDGQVIASQADVKLHAGAFYVGLRPEGYVAQAGQPQKVNLLTLDPQGQPVANRQFEVSVFSREWYSVRQQGSDGRFYFTSAYTDTLVQTLPAVTGDQGRGEISFTPQQGGSYRLLASAKDDGGRSIKASAFTWAYGGDTFWGINDSDRVDLIADKTGYKAGDTAKVLVTAPYNDMKALMTIEQGQVIEHKLLTLTGSTGVLEVPIKAEYAPNIYVSLVLIRPSGGNGEVPDVRVGLVNLPVSTEQQELTINISADKPQAGPRDDVTYRITTSNAQGVGVPAEVSLALVDKAVLSLLNDSNPSLRQSFYEKRPLGVFTSQSLTALVDRVTLKLQPGTKGGAGGGVGDSVLLRRDFPDTAFWNPTLVTGADGTASVTIRLPDSLTTWRLSARGVTKDTLVGQATQEIVATRPLYVRPSFPRFLTVGDKVTLQAVVQNNTGNALDATVTLATSSQDGETAALTLAGQAEQTVNVPANGVALVQWDAEAPSAGTVVLRLNVSGGGMQDALEQTLPVQRYATPETVASAGQVIDQVVETIRAPQNQTQGEVVVELVPSLAAGVQSGLTYLDSFPYACTEQTVSAFLPNAVTYRVYKQLGVDNPTLKTALETNLAAGLQRLASLQNLNGGWGWWAGDKSHPYLTAYAVQGLVEATKAGYGVDQGMLNRGIAYLNDVLANRESDNRSEVSSANARAYILFVLSEAGQADRGRTVALYDQREKLDIYGRAYLLMALKTLGDADRANDLVNDLTASATMRPTSVHWEERQTDYWNMGSDTRTTALALQALVRAQPDTVLVPNAVRYLMSIRENGHWRTTQESATALLALTEYIGQSKELQADYSYRASLDNQTLREGQVNRDNLNDPITFIVSLADLKQGGESQLALQRQAGSGTGGGRLYYTLRMRSYQDAASVQPLDLGVALRREYIAVNTDTLTPTGDLVTQAKLGDLVQVRLTLTIPEHMDYFALEDMLPAGLEALDTSLRTTSAAVQDPTLQAAEDSRPYWWYFNQSEIRDNRVALFATSLPRGTYTYTYLARASAPGTFQVLPATAYTMYAPEVFGRSAGAQFTVTR